MAVAPNFGRRRAENVGVVRYRIYDRFIPWQEKAEPRRRTTETGRYEKKN